MATSEFRNDFEASRQHPEWHNVVVWTEVAENCAQYLARRRQFYIEGTIRVHARSRFQPRRQLLEDLVPEERNPLRDQAR